MTAINKTVLIIPTPIWDPSHIYQAFNINIDYVSHLHSLYVILLQIAAQLKASIAPRMYDIASEADANMTQQESRVYVGEQNKSNETNKSTCMVNERASFIR